MAKRRTTTRNQSGRFSSPSPFVDVQRNDSTTVERNEDRLANRLNLMVRSETADVETRSVEVILATENRVLVYDRQSRRAIEEILLMNGMIPIEHAPMLNDHKTWSLDEVWGSVRNFRTSGGKLYCRFFFADLSEIEDDDEAKRIERAWLKVQQGHLKAVSIGYRVFSGVVIEPGETRKINGKIYRAGELPLRVATRWKPNEGSLTVKPADDKSHIRNEESGMNPKLLAYLQSQGLRSDATIGEAWDYLAKLQGQQRSAAEALIQETDEVPETFTRSDVSTEVDDPNTASGTPPTEGQRSDELTNEDDNTIVGLDDAQRTAVDTMVADRIRSERQRVADIQRTFQQAGIDNQALMTRAINENWSANQTAAELLPMIRSQMSDSVGADNHGGHLGIHSARAANTDALAAAMLLREGLALDHPVFESSHAVRSRIPAALRGNINSEQRQQALELAHQYESMSLVDICRAGLQLDGQTVPHNREEMIRAAVSSGSVQAIFTTNVSARVLASFMEAPDTTTQWTTEADVPNFQSNERITMGKYGPLTKHARGKSADHMDTDATKEEYKIARYSGKVVIDEMDIIDDRMGSMDRVTPEDIGLAARELRPNLVYSHLLANPTLNATGAALFTSGQGNLFSGSGDALSRGAIGAGLTAMQKQRIKERVLNIMLKYLIVPPELALLLDQILRSVEIRESDAANGVANYLTNKGLVGIAEERLGAAGVTDPDTGVHYSGSATNYFGIAQPGRNGVKTIEVGFLRGSGRAPQIRTMSLGEIGTWGIGHDVKMDIGVKALDYRGMQKHAGA